MTDAGSLDEAVRAVDAPDVVFALSRHGHRTVRSGGTAPPPPVPRDGLRYEIGSASKTFTGLLLADLVRSGALSGTTPAARLLDPARPPGRHPVTLTHLMTHTSGLPPLPADFYPQALPRWRTNPYAHYPPERVVRAFLRGRPRHRPGTRWRYSNFAVAVLGHTLAAATATPWERLLSERVLRPLGLNDTAPHPTGPGTDATGHRADGTTPVPPLRIGGFQAAGALRATPHDLLTFLEAHLEAPRRPDGAPLTAALREVRRPLLRRGRGHAHTHTLAWFHHPAGGGATMYFHIGATSGQVAFLGFRPDTGTALVALSTRRHRTSDALVPTAYAMLSSP
ncbi:class A beta-lactamase-related serine hydrolase [Streptomyces sp. WAC05374]|uniref:serine hydrolase domain-containing protein n=3 Tax=Streptomyces sp. WAC05374 TaxID=2487420 RepID=UPI001056240A|nr:serine hydrolase domain-containing protein [Streptomyces sp. WAC05374]TDF50499.1 class A beta-lactamase-related serine hydrolase [Streptomyces sp. WAC05374]TDF51867.1 class A beta-lactamase-related serine hydrolase [Streptomyces sp. WAC05374]TDF60753.1 class A beta-lactamase-related serine hydrolase [Streptomyces sp. WAC05374]